MTLPIQLRRRLTLVSLALLSMAVAAPLCAQEDLPAPDEIVAVTALVSLSGVHAQGTAQLAVAGEILSGWHVNAHIPSEEFLIPTEVRLEAAAGLSFGDMAYPAGEMVNFEFADTPLRVYEGRFLVFIPVLVAAEATPGPRQIQGVLAYQPCSDRICLPPTEVPFSLALEVAAPGAAVAPLHPEIFATAGEARDGAAPGDGLPTAKSVSGTGPLVFGLIFLGGLALNLTPCVFPLIPITVSFFGGQVGRSASGTFGLSTVYVLGMSTTYSLLGWLAAQSGGLFGAALQSPWVLGLVALVLVLLALSQFGFYEFRIPGTSRLGSRKGITGAYFMGLVVGLVAAPCIGPFVVGLLTAVAQEGRPLLGLAKFFVLSLGLGTPFLFLGAFSGALSWMPRAGEWMESVKQIFGLVLVIMAAYFLAQADLGVLSRFLLPATAAGASIFLILLGWSRRGGWLGPLRLGLAVAGLLWSVWLVWPDASERIPFEPYSSEAVAAAARAGRPVIIDFTADWCVPCKEFDHYVFNDAKVVAAAGAFVNLQADLTRSGSTEVKELISAYNIFGPPTIVFLDAQGREREDLRIIGYLGPGPFLQRLQAAAGG